MEMIPKRNSLVAQTTEVLRKMIMDGEWDDLLPTEAQLKARMQVGRNTVRAALSVLENEKLISGGRPGLRREILKSGRRKRPQAGTKVVAFLSPSSLEQSRSQVIFTIDGLRDHLAEMGYRLELHTSKAYQIEQPDRTLEALIHKNPADLWVLHLSSRAMQEWFSKRGIPCLIHGSTHEGIQLPCVDLDYAAITRHAVGQLISKGHDRIAMMLPKLHLYGDEQAEAAFWASLQVDNNPARKGSIIRIPANTPEGVCNELKRTVQQSEPPTALILWRANYASTIFSYAHQLGINIPENLSIICTDNSPTVEWLVPDLARYRTEPNTFIAKLFRTIYKLLTIGPVGLSRTIIIPDWYPGASVTPPPAP